MTDVQTTTFFLYALNIVATYPDNEEKIIEIIKKGTAIHPS